MAKSKLVVSPSELRDVFSDGEFFLIALNQISWATIAGLTVDRLKWQASYAFGEEAQGLADGELAIKELFDIMPLEDLLLQIAESGGSNCCTPEKGLATELYNEPTRTPSPFPSPTYPSEENGNTPEEIYPEKGFIDYPSVNTWKCRLAQYWVEGLKQGLEKLIDDITSPQDAVMIVDTIARLFLGEELSFMPSILLSTMAAIIDNAAGTADQALADAVTYTPNLVQAVYEADNPDDASKAVHAILTMPWPRIFTRYVLGPVFDGRKNNTQITDAQLSSFSASYCDGFIDPAGWNVCVGNTNYPIVLDGTTPMVFTTEVSQGVSQVQIIFPVPMIIDNVFSKYAPITFNFNWRTTATTCGETSWPNNLTAANNYNHPSGVGGITAIRLFGGSSGSLYAYEIRAHEA